MFVNTMFWDHVYQDHVNLIQCDPIWSNLIQFNPIWSNMFQLQMVPALRAFWDLEKTVLHEIRVSETVLWSPTNTNSPTYMYISQKTG